MNFKRNIMCIGLLGLIMQPTIGFSADFTGAAARELGLDLTGSFEPTLLGWYLYTMLHSYLAVRDAACVVPGFVTDMVKKTGEHWGGYAVKHPIFSGLSGALMAYLLYQYFPFSQARRMRITYTEE